MLFCLSVSLSGSVCDATQKASSVIRSAPLKSLMKEKTYSSIISVSSHAKDNLNTLISALLFLAFSWLYMCSSGHLCVCIWGQFTLLPAALASPSSAEACFHSMSGSYHDWVARSLNCWSHCCRLIVCGRCSCCAFTV